MFMLAKSQRYKRRLEVVMTHWLLKTKAKKQTGIPIQETRCEEKEGIWGKRRTDERGQSQPQVLIVGSDSLPLLSNPTPVAHISLMQPLSFAVCFPLRHMPLISHCPKPLPQHFLLLASFFFYETKLLNCFFKYSSANVFHINATVGILALSNITKKVFKLCLFSIPLIDHQRVVFKGFLTWTVKFGKIWHGDIVFFSTSG